MGERIDLTGQKFGRLTVIGWGGLRYGVSAEWLCLCDCGTTTAVLSINLRKGRTRSCGCLRKLIDLTGQTFGRLTVLGRAENRSPHHPRWQCRCECGEECIVDHTSLMSGGTRSCGCIGRKHGKSGSREYAVWAAMLQRCENPNNKNFHHYGGRGITVCQGWHDASNFLADMGERPEKRSIDRIDNDKGYTCGHCEECQRNGWGANCRWATTKEQNSNRR